MIDEFGDVKYVEMGFIHYPESYERFGNVYKTKEEAEKIVKKRKALRRIHEYMRENDLFFYEVDWEKHEQAKWMIIGWNYDLQIADWDFTYFKDRIKGNLIFRTEEDMQEVLENCKEDLEIYLKD